MIFMISIMKQDIHKRKKEKKKTNKEQRQIKHRTYKKDHPSYILHDNDNEYS